MGTLIIFAALAAHELAAQLGGGAAGSGSAGHVTTAWPVVLAASPFDVPLSQVAILCAGILTILAAYVLVLTAIAKHKEAFGRRPSYDDELRKLRESLDGLAPSEQVDRLITQFATAATKDEVATVMRAATSLIEREIEAHKKAIENQLTEMRTYTHDNVHDLRGYVDLLTQRGEDREQRYSDKIDVLAKDLDGKRSEDVGNLYAELGAAKVEMAGVKKEAETHTQQLASVNVQLMNILQRLPRLRGGDR